MTPIATILPMTILRIEWHDQWVSTSIPILLTSRMTQFEKSKRKKSEATFSHKIDDESFTTGLRFCICLTSFLFEWSFDFCW